MDMLVATNRLIRQGGVGLETFTSAPQMEAVVLRVGSAGSPSPLSTASALSEARAFFQQDMSTEGQRVVLAVHGYDCAWGDGLDMFRKVDAVMAPARPALACPVVGFGWPSDGQIPAYLDDRAHARASAPALANLILEICDGFASSCDVTLCVVAHSMGNYLLAHAAEVAWELCGKPTQHNIFQEVVMLAPDLESSAFGPGGPALALARLARRVTVYYSRRDSVLMASSAKRLGIGGGRLGRQGPNMRDPLPSNVTSVDCSERVSEHSGYFTEAAADMRQVMAGIDRDLIQGRQRLMDDHYRLRQIGDGGV